MKKIIIFLMVIIASTLMLSCKKNTTEPDVPKSTKDLVVNSSFDWKTSKNIELSIFGEKDINVLNEFYVKSATGDTTYYNNMLNMGIDYTIKFNVLAIETKLMVTYGSIEKTLDLTSNTITFNYF
jgi:hypothetical protein